MVGTPGRLLDLARQGHLNLSQVTGLVLDEADKMLDLGFLPDVEKILRLTPSQRQTMLFSATMPGEVVTLARRHLRRPTHVRAEHHDEPAHVPSTEQHVFRAHQMDKIEILARVLQAEGRGLTIVFCRTKRASDQVAAALTTRGFAAAAVHGDLGQGQRERAMRAFRSGKVDVLVATDVAARGLDVDDVTHVVNYECPEDDKAYLHRTGRTGRAGRTGVAVTFVDWARPAALEAHQRRAGARPTRAGRDVLDVRAPVQRAGHPAGCHRNPAGRQARPPRPGGRGSRGHRGDRPQPLPAGGASRGARTRAGHGESTRGGRGDSARGRETGQRKQRVRRRSRSGVVIGESPGEPGRNLAVTAETTGAVTDEADQGGRCQPAGRRRRPPRRRGRRGGAAGQATERRPDEHRPAAKADPAGTACSSRRPRQAPDISVQRRPSNAE